MAELSTASADVPADRSTAVETTQQCGRCRRVFEMEPSHEPGTLAEMWLCANCRVALLGRPTAMKPAAVKPDAMKPGAVRPTA